MPSPPNKTRVVKTLSPTQPGALKLARRYGDALVCVRYRHDAADRRRYTTVELVVDESPHSPRPRTASAMVHVHIPVHDIDMRRRVMMLGKH